MLKTIMSLFTACTLLYFAGSFSACDGGGSDSDSSGGGTVYIYPIKGYYNTNGGDYDEDDNGDALPEMIALCKSHFDTAFTNAEASNASKDRVAPFVSINGKNLKDMPSQYGFSSNARVVGIYQDNKYTMNDKWSAMFGDPMNSISSSLLDNNITANDYEYYTGTTGAGYISAVSTCNSFTSDDENDTGATGQASEKNKGWFAIGNVSCDTASVIMCVAY